MTMNDDAYALGYTWRASGQNLPLADENGQNQTSQMYAFQSISVLANPEASMLSPALGFVKRPMLVYDQYGPVPLFSIAESFQLELDTGGTASSDLIAAFNAAAVTWQLPNGSVVTTVSESQWTIGPSNVPMYALRLVTGINQSSIINVTTDSGTFLFTLPSSCHSDHTQGNIPSAFSAGLTSAGKTYPLPSTAVVNTQTLTAKWYLDDGSAHLYELRRSVDSIQVFPYPSPDFSSRNFYLDTRDNSANVYYLRQVFLGGLGGPFNYDMGTSWGTFAAMDVDAMVVHPNGYVLAVDYANHKLQILNLPGSSGPDAAAQPALPVSGEGVREGLMNHQVAMTVTADGRVLVLEQGNLRIQAFDTVGNPVQCFAGLLKFTIPTNYAKDLDSGNVSQGF
ncbi:MAG: hypothetical protein ACRD3S_12545, partial [Terracidiphilus sp.]